jgi:hypothetical protein
MDSLGRFHERCAAWAQQPEHWKHHTHALAAQTRSTYGAAWSVAYSGWA